MINIDNTIFNSSFSGLANSANPTLFFAMPSQTLSGNEFRIVGTPSVNLSNSNAITSVEVNFGNIETVWRSIKGYIQHTVLIGGYQNFDIICLVKYVGTNLDFTIVVADDTGLTNTIPAINFSFTINTYNAPF